MAVEPLNSLSGSQEALLVVAVLSVFVGGATISVLMVIKDFVDSRKKGQLLDRLDSIEDYGYKRRKVI